MIVEIQDYFNKKRKIYDFLLSFLQSEDSYYDYFEKLLNILQEQEIQNDREEFEHFLRLILNISNYHHQTAGFYDKIEQILLYFKDKIKQTFSNLDIFNIFESNKKILLFLLKEDIIKADKSITNRLLETKIFFFFWPEIKDFLPVEEKRKIESYILNTDPEFFENYENKRKVGENDSYLCSLIRNDSIKEFVFYVNSNNVSFKSKIKRSYFETHAYLNEKQPTLIEYALFFGSIKIYNYLRHKIGTDLPEKTLLYSIHSNNKNLIHLIEDAENIDYKMFLNESIKCHHNDFAKYFENQLLEKGCDTDAVFRHYNYLYFPDCSSYDETEENKADIIYLLLLRKQKIENDLFKGCNSLTYLCIPSTITSICNDAFSKCQSLRQIIIPSSVKEIGQRAFYGCNLLTDVKIPSSVTSIGKFAFGYCSSLTEIEIPSSITVIKESTFNQCTKLNKITLPSSIESVEYDAFSGTISLTIVGSIKRIPPRCFHFNYTLKNVNLPFFLTSIGEMSFNYCASLKNITIHPFVTTIDDSAFNLCKSLEEITLPSSLTSIGYHAFGSCQKLRKILIPSSVTSIGSLAFEKCISLDELYIPSSLTSISKSAFNGIKSIILSDDFKMIPNNCFAGCPTLERVSIPSSVTSFGDYCFSGCKSIREIFIPSCLTSIGKYAFMKCSSLEEISLPESIKNIDEGAFFGCEAIIQVKIPSSITSISNYCFSCCCNLKTITIPSSITSIGNNAFSCCSVLNYVCIPSVTSIGTCAFFKCLLLDKIALSSSPIQIASDAFLGCISLKNSEQMLDINDFRVQDELNENGYLFYLAIKNDNLYKIKTYNSFLFGKSIDFIQEVNISRIDIPEIIKVQKFFFPLIPEGQAVLKSLDPFQSNCYITASEYLQYGNIFVIKEKYLKSKGTINTLMNPLIRNKIIFGVAATMKKLHKKNIIHRGLKLTSIYLDDNLEPKIDTFPFAKDATNSYELHNYADESVFTAPELLMDMEHSFPVDVFSYAFVLYFLFTNDIGMRKHFAMSIFGLICKGSRPNRPDDIPDHYWELIQNCWKQNPDERPTFEDITNILRDDKYALEEFGMKTDLNLLHQYQQRIDPY